MSEFQIDPAKVHLEEEYLHLKRELLQLRRLVAKYGNRIPEKFTPSHWQMVKTQCVVMKRYLEILESRLRVWTDVNKEDKC